MLSSLPAILLGFLFATTLFAQEISSNDVFRAIARTVIKPGAPICSLEPSTPLEPVDDGVLLSFEEWKKKQLAEQPKGLPKGSRDGHTNHSSPEGETSGNVSNVGGTDNIAALSEANIPAEYVSGSLQSLSDVAPHFRVPITDRFNYANMDCSARVHTSHRSAKSLSSILSSKKDKYMLSPCNASKEKQYVVVELCEDIRIDTVQMANFEFFSGVFKDFSVSVSKTYTTDPDGWTFAGMYRAKNVRGVQSFHPPTSLRDFYRFIRIDFLSHYGNEYYCPVSLLRVYGLTHLEEWKWDIWQAESRAKLEKGAVPAIQHVSVSVFVDATAVIPTASSQSQVEVASASTSTSRTMVEEHLPTVTHPTASGVSNISSPTSSEYASTETGEISPSVSAAKHASPSTLICHSSFSQPPFKSPTSSSNSEAQTTSIHEIFPNTPQNIIVSPSHIQNQGQSINQSIASIPSASSIPGASPAITPQSSHSVPQAHSPPPLPPSPPTGESIYRTIMNRLNAVENNQTLYMKYVEQQNGAMRDVIRRLGEDLGRLEGITRAQGLTLQRAISDWEKQRYQLQMEYRDIFGRIETLSEEIILEKRLGIAQLCLLLAVLVFLSLTRGSRPNQMINIPSSPVLESGPGSERLREWGRRHLSWTGDWSRKLSGKRNSSEGHEDSTSGTREQTDTKTSAKRPKPLVLGSSTRDNIVRAYVDNYVDTAEISKLPFPSFETYALPHTGNPMNRLRTRTTSTPRSRTGSGTATPLSSALVAHGHSRRIVLQRPVTPTSRAHFVFRTPQAITRSHSLSRTNGSVGLGGGGQGKITTSLTMPQSSSWGGPLSVVPKSAKNWARTAHLHEVKAKRQQDQLCESGNSKRRKKSQSTETGDDDDRFFESSTKRASSAMFTRLRHARESGDLPPHQAEQRLLEFSPDGSTQVVSESQESDSDVSFMMSPQDESDPWVDTDSASLGDGNEEIVDISSPRSPHVLTTSSNIVSVIL